VLLGGSNRGKVNRANTNAEGPQFRAVHVLGFDNVNIEVLDWETPSDFYELIEAE
jgi:hypothetical protein